MSRARRLLSILVGATLASILVASSATAITWVARVPMTSSGDGFARNGLANTGSRFHVLYTDDDPTGDKVMYRRSGKSGLTFSDPVAISTADVGAFNASIGASSISQHIRAVWNEQRDDVFDVYFRRSDDNGVTWKPIQQLTTSGNAASPAVAMGGNRIVLVAYTGRVSGRIWLLRSTNDGRTFGEPVEIARTTNEPFEGNSVREGAPQIAFGRGAVYVSYFTDESTIKIRRSTDYGKTWGAATTIATDAFGGADMSLDAAGSHVAIGYPRITTNIFPVIRRSSNKGSTWSAPIEISSPNSPPAFEVRLLISGSGTWRAAFERCNTDSCTGSRTFLKTSHDAGRTWATLEVASKTSREYAFPGGIAKAGANVGILYNALNAAGDMLDVNLRIGN